MIIVELTDGCRVDIDAAMVKEIVCSVFGDLLVITMVDGKVYEARSIQCRYKK